MQPLVKTVRLQITRSLKDAIFFYLNQIKQSDISNNFIDVEWFTIRLCPKRHIACPWQSVQRIWEVVKRRARRGNSNLCMNCSCSKMSDCRRDLSSPSQGNLGCRVRSNKYNTQMNQCLGKSVQSAPDPSMNNLGLCKLHLMEQTTIQVSNV